MRANVALPSAAATEATLKTWVTRGATILERRRWWVLGVCVVGQWAFIAQEALNRIPHNGWLYQHGDDGPWYWTSAWTLTSLHVPVTEVGLGWPYLLTPLAAIFGPDMADGLPAIVALNVLVLAPASVVGMYLIGERIAGRLFGVWTACLWVLAPLLALALYSATNRPVVVETFLPTGLGLNSLSDYPSMVCAIFAAYLLLRALDDNDLRSGALCGIALGFLVLLKPGNGPLVLAGLLVLALAFRHRALVAIGAMLPALLALALWKQSGRGMVPLLSLGTTREAMGSPAPVAANLDPYLRLNWHHLGQNVNALGQVFWSVRLLELLLVAGAIGLLVRGRMKGLLVVGWFVAFAVIKASPTYAGVKDTSVYRFLLPAWPAWVLIVAAVVLCWPVGAARRVRQRSEDEARSATARPPARGLIAAAAALLAVGPLVLAAAASPVHRGTVAQMDYGGAPVTIEDFQLRARQIGPHTVELDWSHIRTSRARYAYRIFKGDDAGCHYANVGAPDCLFRMPLITSVRRPVYIDRNAGGRKVYRVALAEGTRVQPDNTALLLLSKPIVFVTH